MSQLEDTYKKAGLSGVALQQLRDELELAQNDATHELRGVISAFNAGNAEKSMKEMQKVFNRALTDSLHPLNLAALVFLKIPALLNALNTANTFLEFEGVGQIESHLDMEQYLKISGWGDDSKKMQRSRQGASEGGKKGAASRAGKNESRDKLIRRSTSSISDLSLRFGISKTRIRQIKKES